MKLANIILMMGLGSLFMTLLFMMIASIILGMDFLQASKKRNGYVVQA
ncbi:hypothetical protein [Brevibacillus sp. AG]|nr:hypothetical protein [Brevibacillus sp. AG]